MVVHCCVDICIQNVVFFVHNETYIGALPLELCSKTYSVFNLWMVDITLLIVVIVLVLNLIRCSVLS